MTDRERCLALEARVAELEEELAAYRENEAGWVRDGAYLERERRVRQFLARGGRLSGGPAKAAMLIWFIDHPGAIATRDRLLTLTRAPGANPDFEPGIKIVDVHVSRIRDALERSGIERMELRNLWGRGYRLEPAAAAKIKAMIGEAA